MLACGGFEANPRDARRATSGPAGSSRACAARRYNTGEGIRMALDAGAQPYGHWSGCHAVAWDADAPPSGDREIGDRFRSSRTRSASSSTRAASASSTRAPTSATTPTRKYGARDPESAAARRVPALRRQTAPAAARRVRMRRASRSAEADDDRRARRAARRRRRRRSCATVDAFNAACTAAPFDPAVKDGKRTLGITPPKSNWAQPLDTPPFVAFAVTCGITFTFGGLRIDTDGARAR